MVLLAFLLAANGAMAQINLNKSKQSVLSGVNGVSSYEIGAALKEALVNGASKGSDLASQVDEYFRNDGIKILFPPEMQQVETRLRQLGMGAEVDKFVLSLNRAAEDAAKEAKPIFVSAIRQMNIQDGYSILKGEQDAATQYLQRTTSAQLTEKFSPIIKNS